MGNFGLFILGVIIIAVAFEVYPPLGVSLFVIAMISMLVR
jgi:hypothetical protein